MGFFIVNNGDLPNCEKVQQLRCSICLPHVVPVSLIGREKKREEGHYCIQHLFWDNCYEKTCSSEHLELLTTFAEEVIVVIDINSKSQTMGASGGCRAMHHAKKCSKVVPSPISNFLGAKLLTRSWMRFKNNP
jgi:hypothetical protein